MIGDFSIEDAKKRLGEASWTTGTSPMKYETIQQSSFYKQQNADANAKKQLFELKSRISASSVMKHSNQSRENQLLQYQTCQHATH